MESNAFGDLVQKNIVNPVKERFRQQNGKIEDCVKRVEAVEKMLNDLKKALSELEWGD